MKILKTTLHFETKRQVNKIYKALFYLLRKESSKIIQLKLAIYTLILYLNNYYVKEGSKISAPGTAM